MILLHTRVYLLWLWELWIGISSWWLCWTKKYDAVSGRVIPGVTKYRISAILRHANRCLNNKHPMSRSNVPENLISQHLYNSLATGPMMPNLIQSFKCCTRTILTVELHGYVSFKDIGMYIYVVEETVSLKGNSRDWRRMKVTYSFFLITSLKKLYWNITGLVKFSHKSQYLN